MSSGIIFRNVDSYCSNGMAEYLLELCVSEFKKIDGNEKFPHVLEFFTDYREMFFSGLSVIINEDDFDSKEDFKFIARLFKNVFAYAEGDSSELREAGKEKIRSNFYDLIEELNSYAE